MLQLFATLLVLSVSTVKLTPVDNSVVGQPEIECNSDSVFVSFNTANFFTGHIYVKGRYNESGCSTGPTQKLSASIKLAFNQCGLTRKRSLNPIGISIESVIVIMFHPQFLTKVDRAYAVKCFYMEAEKTVSSQLEVSNLATTGVLSESPPMPTCKYEVLRGGANGVSIRYATIGEPVYHKWSCATEPGYNVGFCMSVHSCYVDDGQGTKIELLNRSGCAQDRYLLNNLAYQGDLIAGQESHVFKYADKPSLFFQCQISIAIRDGPNCLRPSCSDPPKGKKKRSLPTTFNSHLVQDVFTDSMGVLDIDTDRRSTPPNIWLSYMVDRRETICVSTVGFGICVSLVLVILISTLATSVVIICRTGRHK